ncbi:MAG: glycogen synthase, partial [Oscillospiraceae bacterium]
DHKGFDLVKYVFDEIIATDVQVMILGSGEKMYEDFFQEMHWRYPDKVGFYRGYNPQLAKRIYAGADMFLMPSKSEPCGLAQMIAARYGTVPIVRATGGLKDSIIDAGDDGIGYTFQSYNAGDMLNAIRRARECYRNKTEWSKLMTRAMKADFSWASSAKLYIGLYKELCGG